MSQGRILFIPKKLLADIDVKGKTSIMFVRKTHGIFIFYRALQSSSFGNIFLFNNIKFILLGQKVQVLNWKCIVFIIPSNLSKIKYPARMCSLQ